MIKMSELREHMEHFFKTNKISYINLNEKHKNIPIQIYMLLIKNRNKKNCTKYKEIPVMVTIFKSSPIIFFECYNIYKISTEESTKILKTINLLNQITLPGKYFLEDNTVSYRCIIDYSKISDFSEIEIKRILDSMLPAYFIFLDKLNGSEKNGY